MIAILVLAAGKSSRSAPANKLLAPGPDGIALIGRTVDNAMACAAGPALVVTGHQAEQIRSVLAGKPVRFIHAADYAEGIAASLRAGIAALANDIDAVLICLGDMPLVKPAILRRIIAAYDPGKGHEIVLPTYEGKRGNPVLWGRRFFPELLKLTGDTGGSKILRRFQPFICELPVESEAVHLDFDTKEELETAWNPQSPG